MDDTPRTQRAFARAYGDGELDRSEAATALERYDELDAREQDAADELVAETGDDGTEFLAEADDDTVQRAVADGGIDGYDRTKADLLADDSVDSAMVNRVDDRISELDGDPAERARDLIDDTDEAGVRLIDDLDDGTLNRVFGDSDIDADDLARATRKYDALDRDGDRAAQFRRFLDDDELRESWIETVGDTETTSGAIERTLRRIDAETGGDSSLRVEGFVTAREMNNQFPDDWNDPFASGSVVTRLRTTGDEDFVRVHMRNNQNGRFLMRQSDIEGLSPEDIERKYSLSYTPTSVSDVEVPDGTRVNMGTVKANFGGDEGAKQFNLGRELDDGQYTNRRPIED